MDDSKRYQAFQDAVSFLAAIWLPGNLFTQASKRWELCEDMLPYLEGFYQIYTEHSSVWERYEVNPTFPVLLIEAAAYLQILSRGQSLLETGPCLCQRANISQEPLASDMHLTMGALSNETNDVESCLKHNTLCFALRKAEAAKNNKPDLRLAIAHSQMGIAYMMIKKFALATGYFKQ